MQNRQSRILRLIRGVERQVGTAYLIDRIPWCAGIRFRSLSREDKSVGWMNRSTFIKPEKLYKGLIIRNESKVPNIRKLIQPFDGKKRIIVLFQFAYWPVWLVLVSWVSVRWALRIQWGASGRWSHRFKVGFFRCYQGCQLRSIMGDKRVSNEHIFKVFESLLTHRWPVQWDIVPPQIVQLAVGIVYR